MTDQPLFAYRRPTRAKKPKDPVVGKATTRLMLHVYTPLYLARFGQPPLVGQRDWGELKGLVATYGDETVEQYLRFFMAWPGDDWFIQRGPGWTMRGLKHRWETITPVLRQSSKAQTLTVLCQHAPQCADNAEHSRRNFLERMG